MDHDTNCNKLTQVKSSSDDRAVGPARQLTGLPRIPAFTANGFLGNPAAQKVLGRLLVSFLAPLRGVPRCQETFASVLARVLRILPRNEFQVFFTPDGGSEWASQGSPWLSKIRLDSSGISFDNVLTMAIRKATKPHSALIKSFPSVLLANMLRHPAEPEAISEALSRIMLTVLPAHLIPLWERSLVEEQPMTTELGEMYDWLDSEIIRQAATFGWELTLAPVVQARLSAWERSESKGYNRLEDYLKSLHIYNLTIHGVHSPQLSRGEKEYKTACVRELRKVFKAMPLTGKDSDLPRQFGRLVAERNCRALALNLELWLDFFSKKPELLRTYRRTPAMLYDMWGATRTVMPSPDRFRKLVSNL